jgi:microcystin-dependent protein
MADYITGEIRAFGGQTPPDDWMLCDGSLLPITQYQALYALIGTIYGGDGVNTFAVPDFRGRLVVGQGQTPPPPGGTSSNFVLGQSGGSETVSLTPAQNAAHTHAFNAVNAPATSTAPVGGTSPSFTSTMALATVTPNGTVAGLYMATNVAGATNQTFDPNFLDYAGGAASGGSSQTAGNPHNNVMPFIAITYMICVNGLYPTRS